VVIDDTEVASGRDAQLVVPLDDMGIIADCCINNILKTGFFDVFAFVSKTETTTSQGPSGTHCYEIRFR